MSIAGPVRNKRLGLLYIPGDMHPFALCDADTGDEIRYLAELNINETTKGGIMVTATFMVRHQDCWPKPEVQQP